MKYARARLLGYGVLICALGVLFILVATNLSAYLFGMLGRPDPIAGALIDYLITLLRLGMVPLGAMLIAAGIAIHLLDRGREIEAAGTGSSGLPSADGTPLDNPKPID